MNHKENNLDDIPPKPLLYRQTNCREVTLAQEALYSRYNLRAMTDTERDKLANQLSSLVAGKEKPKSRTLLWQTGRCRPDHPFSAKQRRDDEDDFGGILIAAGPRAI